ncbi:MAG TPA: hypothetical protein VN619_02075 [Lacisediminihabitans sp.]|jgi:hypothetical protein|nr:hypothetical protein [Lacisediminihabitans sp.]HXD60694.1 hypothetical protein [Lacisediminihabitans sp.]
MISTALARRLRELGLEWHPVSGDAFCIDRDEFESEVFTVSDMTVEAHVFDTGTILGFNGTTEWALDSVALEDALWLPREAQLRSLLGGTFQSLERHGEGYRLHAVIGGESRDFDTAEATDAYAEALCALLQEARD